MDIEGDSESGPLDWGVPTLNMHNANPNISNESGRTLELQQFDSLYNSDGERIILPAGERYIDKNQYTKSYQSAIVVTKIWSRDLKVESKTLEIKSPHMKAAIKATVPAYNSAEITIQHIRVTGPPHFLWHYREDLQHYGEELEKTDLAAARHILFLLGYMWNDFLHETISYFTSMSFVDSTVEKLEFDCLWMVFRPGDLVLIRQRDQDPQDFETAFEFLSMTLIDDKFWNVTGIQHYDGQRAIRELELVPMSYLNDDGATRSRLIARGKYFTSLHGQHYRFHVGGYLSTPKAIDEHDDDEYDEEDDEDHYAPASRSQTIGSRIMVDRGAYVAANPGSRKYLLSSRKTYSADDAGISNMTEEELIICSDLVHGYSFRSNSWGIFHIDNLEDITMNTTAFDQLILCNTHKQQILSLVKVHDDKRLRFDDFIKGKGRGVIFLLYGEPGTGKTLTAEGIADYCHKPLLRLDAASLGTTASSVEKELKKAFKIAETWHAVVLLDEADVFLEQRQSRDLSHNAIVSVFLRMLEYYQGILILTTNRVGCFDTAFQSRIHLAIRYPPLSQESRGKLWYTFLRNVSEQTANDLHASGALDQFAAEPFNGRQIKNLIRTAAALAINDESADGKINEDHLTMALGPMKEFLDDMKLESEERDGEAGPEVDGRVPKRRRLG
ncbi:hypothetical protein PG984_016550 [Apiospora sp. TS-2023a]